MQSFSVRNKIGATGQEELKAILTAQGFIVTDTGQENWLAKATHNSIRYNYSDKMIRAVRYTPDFLAYHPQISLAYWEVKVNTVSGTKNFTIEKACYEECMARFEKGEGVIVAFKDTDHTWHANYIQRLVIYRDMSGERHNANGSQTPYLLIFKTSTKPLSEFLIA